MALAVICITIRVFSYSHALQMSQQGRAYTGSMTNPLYLATNKIPLCNAKERKLGSVPKND